MSQGKGGLHFFSEHTFHSFPWQKQKSFFISDGLGRPGDKGCFPKWLSSTYFSRNVSLPQKLGKIHKGLCSRSSHNGILYVTAPSRYLRRLGNKELDTSGNKQTSSLPQSNWAIGRTTWWGLFVSTRGKVYFINTHARTHVCVGMRTDTHTHTVHTHLLFLLPLVFKNEWLRLWKTWSQWTITSSGDYHKAGTNTMDERAQGVWQ